MDMLIATALTVLGTLGGVFLGSYLQGRSRKEEWLRQDSQRWLEQRRTQYASFINLMDSSFEAFVLGFNDGSASAVSSSNLYSGWTEIKLMAGSDNVVRAAGRYAKLFEETVSCYKEVNRLLAQLDEADGETDIELGIDVFKSVTALAQGVATLPKLSAEFLSEARLELSLPILNEAPVKHPAEQTSIYAKRELNKLLDQNKIQLGLIAEAFRQAGLRAE